MSLMKTLLVTGFVGTVILVECLLAYLMIPDTAAIEAAALAKAEAEMAEKKVAAEGDQAEGSSEMASSRELDLGKFNIMIHRPSNDITLRVSFHLIGTVKGDQGDDTKELLERNQHRLRDRIIFEVRNSEIADLSDPGLGLIKRRILSKTNELLGKPLLESVVFSEFSYVQL
jgi:flagellar FliL protein